MLLQPPPPTDQVPHQPRLSCGTGRASGPVPEGRDRTRGPSALEHEAITKATGGPHQRAHRLADAVPNVLETRPADACGNDDAGVGDQAPVVDEVVVSRGADHQVVDGLWMVITEELRDGWAARSTASRVEPRGPVPKSVSRARAGCSADQIECCRPAKHRRSYRLRCWNSAGAL